MIHAKIEKFNKENLENLISGEQFHREELYDIVNAMEWYKYHSKEFANWVEEKQILFDMTIEKLNALILEDLKSEK